MVINKFKLAIGIISLIGVLLIGTAVYFQRTVSQPLTIAQPTLFTVHQGDSLFKVFRRLTQQQLYQGHPLILKWFVRINGAGLSVKAGTFELLPGMNLHQVLKVLTSGQEHQFYLSLIEGLTFAQWVKRLDGHQYLNNDIDDQSVRHLMTYWHAKTGTQINSLEGVLLADTYTYTANTDASRLFKRAMDAMLAQLDDLNHSVGIAAQLSDSYQALILASIVEKETGLAEERPEIAGVFFNRLVKKMRLQTDPTVIYGLGERFDGDITRAHLKEHTPYNTYVIKGLPPTPIAMVGRDAIRSVYYPATTDKLYFVAKGDGSHYFSSTLAEHNQAVRKYQLKQ